MKKVFSSLFLVFLLPYRAFKFPIKILKKSKIDNFLGGLIVGALFSLLVNILTIQIQELMQKQRILEAVETEIVTNMLQAKSDIENAIQQSKENAHANPYITRRKFSRNLWYHRPNRCSMYRRWMQKHNQLSTFTTHSRFPMQTL